MLTLFLGNDDDYRGTTLFDSYLLPDVLSHATSIEATARGHPHTFYRRHGYSLHGLAARRQRRGPT